MIFNTKEKTAFGRRRPSKRPWRYQRPNKKSKLLALISKILQDYQWSYCWDYYRCYKEEDPSVWRALEAKIFKVQGQDSVERSKKRFDAHEKEVRRKLLSSFEEILLETIKGQGFCEETILSNYHSKYENTSK